ncbi:universal stress protein [Streptomyces sp. NPDC127084]|uniref:universal stress protein n=1 Tax=Streptomyces sp. NPDC127084 TaxID=3347133 RepID=UPI003654078B
MERLLVVGVDGSADSLRAVDWAADEAATHNIPLRIIHASRGERYTIANTAASIHPGTIQMESHHVMDHATKRAFLRHRSLRISSVILNEFPIAALFRASQDAYGVVIGSRGWGSEARPRPLGTVAMTVAASAMSPVVVVREIGREPGKRFHRVAAGIGPAQGTEAVLEFAVRDAALRMADLEVVYGSYPYPTDCLPESHARHISACDPNEAEPILERVLRERAPFDDCPRVQRRFVRANPTDAILQASSAADTLVLGACRRDSHVGMQLGRVSDAALRNSSCPVILVPYA